MEDWEVEAGEWRVGAGIYKAGRESYCFRKHLRFRNLPRKKEEKKTEVNATRTARSVLRAGYATERPISGAGETP